MYLMSCVTFKVQAADVYLCVFPMLVIYKDMLPIREGMYQD